MIIKLFAIMTVGFLGSSFVLLGPTEPRLEVTESDPNVEFKWHLDQAIAWADLKDYRGGQYIGLDNMEIFKTVIRHSMEHWNNITDSFVNLILIDEKYSGDLEDSAGTNLLRFAKLSGAFNSGEAVPSMNIGRTIIEDCDISLSLDSVSFVSQGGGSKEIPVVIASMLEIILTHELGHCLGLGHPHTSSKSIMSYKTLTQVKPGIQTSLAIDDMAGAIYLYPTTGDPSGFGSCGSMAYAGGDVRSQITNNPSMMRDFPGMMLFWLIFLYTPFLLRYMMMFFEVMEEIYHLHLAGLWQGKRS
ncbi:MAG: matrixin family metalloprotease [Proteobacteria bacterium]|nr:matrixin family metalloprotease [Pseudomonadota bacterium]